MTARFHSRRSFPAVSVLLALGLLTSGWLGAVGLGTDEERARYLLEKGELSLMKGNTSEAVGRLAKVASSYPGTLSAVTAQIRLIEVEEGRHRWVDAFDACQDFFEHFPDSPHFLEVLETQIRISLRVQKEKASVRLAETESRSKSKNRVAGLPDDDSVSKMFRLVLKNGAHTPFEAEIRYGLAVALEREERPKSARAAFAELIEYDRENHLADDAAFQRAYIEYKKVIKGEHARLFAAQLELRDFLERYEKSEKVAEARYCLTELDKLEAASLLSQARYYEGLGKNEAALVYYDKLFAENYDQIRSNRALWDHVTDLRATVPDDGGILRAEPSESVGGPLIDWPFPQSFGILNAVENLGTVNETTMTGEGP